MRIRPSKRKQEQRLVKMAARLAIVEQALARDGNRCQAEYLVPTVRCGGPLDVHELCPRSTYPGGELDLANTVSICRNHHLWVDTNPSEAHEVDLHRFSWEVA